MGRLLFIVFALLLVAAALFVVGLVALLLVVFAYGLGGLLTRFLPVETGQATLLALIAIIAAAAFLWEALSSIMASSSLSSAPADTTDDWDEDEFDEDELDDADEADEPVAFVASIPRWRQPLKTTRYEGTDRNAPCPCGSGRKYKNCHGRPNSTP